MKKTLAKLLLFVVTAGLSLMSAADVRIICDYPITFTNAIYLRSSGGTMTKDLTLEKDDNILCYWDKFSEYSSIYYLKDDQTLTAAYDGYRCTGWYTLQENDMDTHGSGTRTSLCNTDSPLVVGQNGQAAVSINLSEKLHYAKTSKYMYFRPVSSAAVICPLFVKVWAVKTTISPDGAGTATGDGVYDEGERVQLSATAKDGYQFACWQVGETTVSTEAKYSPTVTADVTYTAVFQPKTYTVSFNKAQGTGGKDSISAIYQEAMPSLDAADLPQRFGWSFAGYFASQNGSGTKYYNADGTSAHNWDKPNSATLYAAWTPNQYDFNIVFPAAGGVSKVCYRIGQSEEWVEVSSTTTVKVNCGETCFAYDLAAAGYQAQYTKEQCWSGTMTGNGLTFTPQPTLRGYQLTVNPNGGIFKGSDEPYTFADQRLVAGEKTLNAIDVPTGGEGIFLGFFAGNESVYDRQGHNVKGTYWTAAYPDGVFQGTKDLTVEARWGKAYQIRADVEPAESGTVEGGGFYEENASVTLMATPNDGYSFSCWADETGFVTNAIPWTFKATSDVAYTAVFTGNVYKVTFRTEGGQPENPVRYVTFGSTYGEFPTVTKSGYLLDGWYTDYDGAGYKVLPESKVSIAKNHNLIANWKEKTTATVIWADQSMTAGNVWVTNEVPKGTQISSPPNETKNWKQNGYWPKGWDPSLSNPVTVNGDTTFSIVWKSLSDVLDCQDLTFSIEPNSNWKIVEDDKHAGDSSLRIDERSTEVSDVVSTSVTEPGRLAFWWKGDAETKLTIGFGEKQISLEGSAGMGWRQETIEIKSASESKPTTVKFLFNTGDFGTYCALDDISWNAGIEYKLSVAVDPSSPYGTVAKNPDKSTYSDGSLVTITAKANDGYAFEKWNDDVTESNRTVTITEDMTYTASFTACVYRVTLLQNGGTGGANEVSATYGEDMPVLESLPQCEHYTFNGYFDAASGGKQYYNGEGKSVADWDKAADAELFAQWVEDGKFTVTVTSANEARGTATKTPNREAYYANAEVTIEATPKAGYAFEQWNDNVTESSRKVTVTSNASYTASFTACVYRVTLNANGGTGGQAEAWATYGEALPNLSSLPTKAMYKFDGFYNAETGGSKYFDASGIGVGPWDKTADAELFAHWTKDVGDVSRALDCDNLVFAKLGDWEIVESHQYYNMKIDPHSGDRFLISTNVSGSLSTTITESGTLSFAWRGQGNDAQTILVLVNNVESDEYSKKLAADYEDKGWETETGIHFDVKQDAPLMISFEAGGTPAYWAIDAVTWTPDAAPMHPMPEAKDAVTISSASVSGGKFSLSFAGDAKFDYNLLTNANLRTDGWGRMETKSGTDETITFEMPILNGLPQLFYKVETIQKQE